MFFDEGDSFACQYSCKANNLCKTMPNATAWHKGDIAAWVGAAKVMAAAGKRAILSSQNAFAADSPELWKEDNGKGCPYKEGVAAAAMKSEGVPWMRFYEYWLTPQSFGVRSDHVFSSELCAAGCCRLDLTNVCVSAGRCALGAGPGGARQELGVLPQPGRERG